MPNSQKGNILSECNESKGFAPILIILLICGLLTIGGYLTYINYSKNQTEVNIPQQISQQSSGITESTGSTEVSNNLTQSSWEADLKDVPIYPRASFLKQEVGTNCPHEIFGPCSKGVLYTFEVKDVAREKIVQWYTKDESRQGWVVSGGGGCEEPAICYATFSKPSESRKFQLDVVNVASPDKSKVNIVYTKY